jgi:exosortase/archaeosortase family protein
MLASILPIALLANILRVLALVLITFYAGDGAGSAFHDAAAFLEIGFAFGAFFAADSLLNMTSRGGSPAHPDSHHRAART